MGRKSETVTLPGLSLADHRELAAELAALQEAVTDLRDRLREASGSAGMPYQGATKVLYAVRVWKDALVSELATEHGNGHLGLYGASHPGAPMPPVPPAIKARAREG